MEYFEPKLLESGNYMFKEHLDGGYLQRGARATNSIMSKWTKDLKLIKFTINDRDDLYFFGKNGKLRKDIKIPDDSFNSKGDVWFKIDRYTALRARNRHLKYLKIYLGIEKPKEKKTLKVIYRDMSWWTNIVQIMEKELTKKGTPNFGNCRYMSWIKWTPKKEKLAKEYNQKKEEWYEYSKNILKEIFEK